MFFPLNQVDFFFTFLLPISFHLSVSPCLWLFHIYLCLLKLGLLFDLHTNTGHLFVYFAIFLFICLLFTASVIISFFMYVECMYVCMYVCLFVCLLFTASIIISFFMYVCMSVLLSVVHSFNYHLFLHVCMSVCSSVCCSQLQLSSLSSCMYVCMHVCISVCMYVYSLSSYLHVSHSSTFHPKYFKY